MKFDFVVLGATGEQGSIAAKDLLNSGYSVLLCGRNHSRIESLLKNKNAEFKYINLHDIQETAKVIKSSGAKIVLNCAELRLNLEVMKACLEAGANYLDLGGLQEMTEKQYQLDKDFREKKLIALLGCGSTPGISNVMTAYAVDKLDTIDHIDLGFGWNSNMDVFVLPYSFESIVHELTTPPVILEYGRFKKTKTCHLEGIKNIKGIGEQYLYCVVHSEVFTFYKYFSYKGLNNIHYVAGFPGHSHKVLEILIELGFGSEDTIDVKGTKIKIRDFTREVLKSISKPKSYREVENVWSKITGIKNGKKKMVLMECITKTIKGFEFAGSNVNTGMPISIMAQMLLKKNVNEIGVTAPESAVPYSDFFKELGKRKIFVYQDGKKIN